MRLHGGSHISNRLWNPPKKRLKSVQFYGTTTFFALDSETKLVPSFLVGKRTKENAESLETDCPLPKSFLAHNNPIISDCRDNRRNSYPLARMITATDLVFFACHILSG